MFGLFFLPPECDTSTGSPRYLNLASRRDEYVGIVGVDQVRTLLLRVHGDLYTPIHNHSLFYHGLLNRRAVVVFRLNSLAVCYLLSPHDNHVYISRLE